jgi:chromate transport protein ChrA
VKKLANFIAGYLLLKFAGVFALLFGIYVYARVIRAGGLARGWIGGTLFTLQAITAYLLMNSLVYEPVDDDVIVGRIFFAVLIVALEIVYAVVRRFVKADAPAAATTA